MRGVKTEPRTVDRYCTRSHFDIETIYQDLFRIGASPFPFLKESTVVELLEDVVDMNYEPLSDRLPTAVDREGNVVDSHPNDMLVASKGLWSERVLDVCDTISQFLRNEFWVLPVDPFAIPLEMNDLAAYKYPEGSQGLGPHCDKVGYKNMIVFIPLSGWAEFFISVDGWNTQTIISSDPGNIVLMRASGFAGHDRTPEHAVLNVEGPRHVLLLSQWVEGSLL